VFGDWGLGAYPLLRVLPLAVSLLQRVPFSNAKKEPKGFAPGVRHFAEAQCSLATVSIRGHRLRFASLHLLSMYAATPHGATRLPRMDTYARPADGAKNQKPHQKPKPDQEPLTLALSRRERGLIEVFGRDTPTRATALNLDFEKHTNRFPLPRERAGVRGESTKKPKPTTRSSPLNRPSVSSPAFDLDLDPRATSEG
jgi:hypothetical protein